VLFIIWLTAKSNKLTVNPGDTVKIKFNKWVYWEPVFTGLITFLSLFIISQLRLHNVLEEFSLVDWWNNCIGNRYSDRYPQLVI